MEEQGKVLHIVMFPWLAIGHLRPFLRLSICLARKGHRISFVSTPRNLQRAVKVPQDVSHLINVVAFPLPEVEHLPPHAESSMDVPHVKQQLLKVAFDLLRPSVRDFSTTLFTAAFMAFLGPPSALMDQKYSRSTAADFTVVPEWIPFPSDMAFRVHEMSKNMEKEFYQCFPGGKILVPSLETDADGNEYNSGTSDSIRFGLSIDGSEIVIFRSCVEFEPEWFDLVRQLYQKPVIPVGVLPVEDKDEEDDSNKEWPKIKQWLDAQKDDSLVYVALGTEAALSQTEARELALGLEQCGLPFFWVLNRNYLPQMLPDGFRERVANRGMVYTEWAPQIKILSHPAVGAFLTHCGWNSTTEALGFGRVLILFPVMNDQGPNARLLQEKKVGVDTKE
ncbi:UNVERIFIED_CONTAM: UDP-glycosyltransferase 91C1 [Sesamum angustifolium]|uniref:UDP-glycosyltransferase 91C1 n=1 Tax=Sesamum angustifolium TaxID=2727405 RepID=A0AAW2PTZ9_9LAMI